MTGFTPFADSLSTFIVAGMMWNCSEVSSPIRYQDRAIVRADLLFLTYMVHNFNAWQSRGDFLATASLLALMRRDREALRSHVDGVSLRFVEQALLFDRDILKALFGGSAEELAFEPAIFLFEEAHPMGQMSELFSQVGCFHASRGLIAGAAKSSQLVNNKFKAPCGFTRHTSYLACSQFSCSPVNVTLSTSKRLGQWNLWHSSRLY
jgi:hypothetical protein